MSEEESVSATAEMQETSEMPPTGIQTRITPRIKKIADTMHGDGNELVRKISQYINSMDVDSSLDGPDFKRTADDVLARNTFNGCNEAGIVMAVLLRANGVPASYIQALNIEAVRTYNSEAPSLRGHVYIEAEFSSEDKPQTVIINSTTGEMTESLPPDMMEGNKGLDSWDIGLRDGFADLQKLFEKKHRELTQLHP